MNDNKNLKINLNEREKKVIASLIQFPGSSDVEIASQFGIKHSTFATIKKRLQKGGYFTKILLPNFAGFGSEIIGINVHNLLTSSMDQNGLDKVDFINSLRANKNLLFSAVENELTFTLSCYKDFEQFDDASWQFDKAVRDFGLEYSFQQELSFPIHYSEFPRFLDYSRSIVRHLDIDLAESEMNHVFEVKNEFKLNITDLGKEILQCFLEAPGRTPKLVSKLIGKPRTTTSRWLRRFIEADLLTPRFIPVPEKLGFQVGLIIHYSIVSSQASIFQKTLRLIDTLLTPVILMRSDFDIVVFSMFRSFESAQNSETEFFNSMTKAGISFRIEYHYLLSLPHTKSTIDFKNVFNSIYSSFRDINAGN